MKIENSSRLSYLLMGQDDGQALWELDQDPEVMQFINGGQPNSMETMNDILLPRLKAFTNAKKGWGIWQVSNKVSQEYLGWVLVRPVDFFTDTPNFKNVELGWRFFKKAWGKGYATEAAIAITKSIVRQSDIDYVSAFAVADNQASINIMKKMGMKFYRKYDQEDPIAVHYQMTVK